MTDHGYWYQQAARSLAAAQTINDQYKGKAAMPLADAHAIESHLRDCENFRRKGDFAKQEAFIAQPQHVRPMWDDIPTKGAQQFGSPFGAYGVGAQGPLPVADGGVPVDGPQMKSFLSFVRSGGVKADLVEDATGQTIIPPDFAGVLLKTLPRLAAIRGLAYVRPTTKKIVDVGSISIASGGWGVLETGTTPVDGMGATPAAVQAITVHELNALVKLGRDELMDSDDNLAQIIMDALSLEFAQNEDDAFANGAGDGSNQPWGVLHGLTQSVTAATAESITYDELVDVQTTLGAQYQRNASWLFHSKVWRSLLLLKDGYGRPLIDPNAMASGVANTLLGKPWHLADGLPAPDATPASAVDPALVYGDFRAGYMIADRQVVTVTRLNERYLDEGKIGLLFTERVGGDVVRPATLVKYNL